MTEPSAKILADSISPEGNRLTTMEIVIHRYCLSEFNTHRALSRNSASSRAIPVKRQIQRVIDDPAVPVSFPIEKAGMQGGNELSDVERDKALKYWLDARMRAVTSAEHLVAIGVHKSVVSRILEPWLMQTIICSATEWNNFFIQRCSPLAQPEIKVAAEAMKNAYDTSTPIPLTEGQWHLPYIGDEDWEELWSRNGWNGIEESGIESLKQWSVARCARVSYKTFEGNRDWDADTDLYNKLVMASPPHASPLEHVATPQNPNIGDIIPGNFHGWRQLRHEVLGETK